MLIEFSIENYLSFKDRMTFTMVAASMKKKHTRTNVFPVSKNLSLLKSALIYGANASGKSNLFKAMAFMKYFVCNSFKETQADEEIDVGSFRLSSETEN
ncbi:AAA family ATPase, partial [Desulfococcaceae bacterium HSG8]|nr:AAA family ATPase [Desulfococcaceae bacterium HSG8]